MTRALRIVAIVAAAAYVVVGLWGLWAAVSYQRGSVLASKGRYDEALPLLETGAVGLNTAEAEWLAGEVALGLADAAQDAATRASALRRATEHYMGMLRATTGSAFGLTGLATAYERAEAAERVSRVTDLAAITSGPWALVGSDGRIAVGLLRVAVGREPATCVAHDELVRLLVAYGLLDEAKEAARDAAAAAPAFEYHAGLDPDRLPREVVEAFASGARSVLESGAPMATRERKLFYLGRLDERIGALERAAEDLRSAHAQPAPDLEHAESAYHLGRVLAALGRLGDAEAAWREAERAPVFRPAVAVERARVAEAGGRADEALRQIEEARRLEPRRMDLILWEARLLVARGERAAAVDTLRWGITVDESDRAPRRALVDALIDGGEPGSADDELTAFERSLGEGEDTRALRKRLESTP
jgi:tetratricopeptide (TPR) repeat protein